MAIKKLKDNNELYKFLLTLKEKLAKSGQVELADKLDYASQFIVNPAGEFLTEAEIALNFVRKSLKEKFSPEEISQIDAVLNQIRVAFEPRE